MVTDTLVFFTKKQKALVFSDEVYRMTVFICYFRRKFPTNNAMPRQYVKHKPCSDLALEYTVLQRIINFRSSLFCDSSTFRFVHISPSAPMIISGTITLVTVFQFINLQNEEQACALKMILNALENLNLLSIEQIADIYYVFGKDIMVGDKQMKEILISMTNNGFFVPDDAADYMQKFKEFPEKTINWKTVTKVIAPEIIIGADGEMCTKRNVDESQNKLLPEIVHIYKTSNKYFTFTFFIYNVSIADAIVHFKIRVVSIAKVQFANPYFILLTCTTRFSVYCAKIENECETNFKTLEESLQKDFKKVVQLCFLDMDMSMLRDIIKITFFMLEKYNEERD
ncbi:hypothetical protein T09_5997, partial [Trichinella sp. T9]